MFEPTHADFLVLGAGIAGLSFALDAAERGTVTVLSKGQAGLSNTAWAQGGIAAVWDGQDSISAHVDDTVEAGADLADPELVRSILAEGPPAVQRLIDRGVGFDRGEEGEHDLTREGGHSARRVLHAGDMTGSAIQQALLTCVRAHPNIQLIEHAVAVDFITERTVARHVAKGRLGLKGRDAMHPYGVAGPEGWMPDRRDRCLGAYVLDATTGRVRAYQASATLLATGGAGKVYRYTSNPDLATGDGMAMAYRAGAVLSNMEFVQFHPTCLFHPRAKTFLVSEALRGEGGILRLPDGTPFMDGVHPMASLAPRDIVAREIDANIKRHGLDCVFLDMTHLDPEYVRGRFAGIHARLAPLGIDIATDLIPVVPAAHYFCGGVQVDGEGATAIQGLYAAGEVTFTGLHGANRLASNSLLEGAVFARRAAQAAADWIQTSDVGRSELPGWDTGGARDPDELVVIAHTWDEIRRLMWNYVGIVRTDRRLKRALARVALIRREIAEYYWGFTITRDLVELRNVAMVADLVIRAALGRRESRGLHFTLDCPDRDDENWRRSTVLRRPW
jgi:L-aspartate oxidase